MKVCQIHRGAGKTPKAAYTVTSDGQEFNTCARCARLLQVDARGNPGGEYEPPLAITPIKRKGEK